MNSWGYNKDTSIEEKLEDTYAKVKEFAWCDLSVLLEASEEIKKLKKLVSKMTLTADGFPVTVGDEVWVPNPYHWKDSEPIIKVLVACIGMLGSDEQKYRVIYLNMSMTKYVHPKDWYSTKEAAEKAIHGKEVNNAE